MIVETLMAFCVEIKPVPQILVDGREPSGETAKVYCPGDKNQDKSRRQPEICVEKEAENCPKPKEKVEE